MASLTVSTRCYPTSTAPRQTSNHVFNRQSVKIAIKSAQQRLKLYNKCPTNGLVLYCGLAVTDESNGKERRIAIHFEPFRPIKQFIYHCDSRFHTENLNDLLVDEGQDPFGFIVLDGNGTLFGSVQGSAREVLFSFSVDLPSKHGRGGQSALRFDRIRVEKRQQYVHKVAAFATKLFISNDRPNVKGIVLAGMADFKDDLLKSSIFDKRLRPIVIKTIDIAHGGDRGFEQAIALSTDAIGAVALQREMQLIEKYFAEVDRDTGRYCFSVEDTLQALEMGAVEDLIVWPELEMNRYELRNPQTGDTSVVYQTKEQEKKKGQVGFHDPETGAELQLVQQQTLVEWICENYMCFGCNLEFVSDRSGIGKQFVLGFGGLGGLLRWKIDFAQLRAYDEVEVPDNEMEVGVQGTGANGGPGDEYGFDDGDFGL